MVGFETEDQNTLYRLFMAPSSSINAFLQEGKKIMSLDGIQTKGYFKHVILIAVSVNVICRFLPLALLLWWMMRVQSQGRGFWVYSCELARCSSLRKCRSYEIHRMIGTRVRIAHFVP